MFSLLEDTCMVLVEIYDKGSFNILLIILFRFAEIEVSAFLTRSVRKLDDH